MRASMSALRWGLAVTLAFAGCGRTATTSTTSTSEPAPGASTAPDRAATGDTAPSPDPAAGTPTAPALGSVQPWIGIALEPGVRGVRVRQAIDNTPGARAGLTTGDEIESIDGVLLHSPRELIELVSSKGVGTEVTLVVWRNDGTKDAPLTVKLALEAKPAALDVIRRKVLGKPAPTVALADAFGPYPTTDFASLKGNVILVELGASWCGFCKSTLPQLAAWQRDLGARGLRVLWISSEDIDTIKTVEPAITGITRARDANSQLAVAVGTAALPTFLVIDRAGTIRHADLGAGSTTLRTIDTLLATLLDEPAR